MFSKRGAELIKFVKSFKSRFKPHVDKYLDVGCGDGKITIEVSKILRVKEVYGLDIDNDSLLIASKRGIRTFRLDLNREKFPFEDNTFDLLSSFDVIQYLINTDNLIREAYRVLKPGGYFLITTVNLASWVNRLLLLLGYLPYFYEISLLLDVERRPFQRSYGVGGVMRLYTFKTLENHIKAYGFDVVYSTTFPTVYTSKNFMMRIVDKIMSKRKTFGAQIAIVAGKEINCAL